MTAAEVSERKKEEGLRLELKGVRERLEATQGALARKEVRVARRHVAAEMGAT